ncbi:MAG: phosphoribosylaminoimidazolesuccinocarboxamide synthase, partial [Leptospiraceae bacterium]|nr:phosphoribosylaminoimidazolesuccinocarboxamide synthase [Leptospiraceae bacterium]
MNPSYSGKVRDIYDLGDSLILCSTDRISAFDVVFEEKIPNKGKILNKISNLWFQYFSEIPNHILETNIENFPKEFQAPEFAERSVWVKKCKRIDIECVVRGYLAGSSYKEYKTTGRIAGRAFPSELKE